MAKKKDHESSEDQVKGFEAEVQRLIDAGELNPTEADEQFEQILARIVRSKPSALNS